MFWMAEPRWLVNTQTFFQVEVEAWNTNKNIDFSEDEKEQKISGLSHNK